MTMKIKEAIKGQDVTLIASYFISAIVFLRH